MDEYSTAKLLSHVYLVVTITHIHITVATNHNNNVITYTYTNHSKIVDSLTSARDCAGVALLDNHTRIVSGGSSGGEGVKAHLASSLSIAEIGTIIPNQ